MNRIIRFVLGACVAAALAAPVFAQVPAPPAAVPAPAPVAVPGVPAAPPAPPAAVEPATPPPPPAAAALAPQAPPAPKPPRPAKPDAAKAPDAPRPAQPPEPEQPPLPGRERGEPDPVNVRFEVTVTSQTGSAAPLRRTAVLTVSNGTGSDRLTSGSLRAGNNVPVANTTLTTRGEDGKDVPAAKPLTSYNWRSVGLNVDVSQLALLRDNLVRATLMIEFSGVDEKTSPAIAAPTFPTFSQRVPLYLTSGKPIVVAQSSDYVDNVERKQTVEVKATVLR